MRLMDEKTIKEFKIPGIVLMENAGREVALTVKRIWNQNPNFSKKIVIFCGKGNNGGDGFVAARYLANWGFKPSVFVLSKPGEIQGDAQINFDIIKNLGINIKHLLKDEDIKAISFLDFSIIVDAIFGTGLKGSVRGIAAKVISAINQSNYPVVAVDIPSGICGTTGKILGNAVKAQVTVTMVLPKTGLYLYPGRELAGRIKVADISMPWQVIDDATQEANLIDENLLLNLSKPYPQDAHKGNFGRMFILAGSKGMVGAAVLAGKAATRCGAGLVTCGIPEFLHDVIASKLTEVMTYPLKGGDRLSSEAVERAIKFSQKCDAVVIGPGLSQEPSTKAFVRQFVRKCQSPLVIDADALNALADDTMALNEAKGPIIITPHPGEMARIFSTTPKDIQENRIKYVKQAAKDFSCIAVLKGASTLIAVGEELFINPTGNPGMATGGSGDVLSGIIGALIARGYTPKEAAVVGTYLHGLAGDLAAKKFGKISMIAGDIIDFIPEAIKKLGYREDERWI